MALALSTNAELLAGILRGTDFPEDPVAAALGATRSLSLVLEDIVRSLVIQARADGRSWADIGEALKVSRQASFQRFGGADAPESLGGGATDALPEADARAAELLEQFLAERWGELRATFDDTMAQRCSVDLLASVRRKVEEDIGAFSEFGPATVAVIAGYTVVNLPLVFDRGDRLGRVAFNGYGQVSGFFVLPPEARVMPRVGGSGGGTGEHQAQPA